MQAANVNELLLDPLAGCLPILSVPGNASTLFDSILLRLRLCCGEKVSDILNYQVTKESKRCGIVKSEYLINELLYELRIGMGHNNESFEHLVLKNWTTKVIGKYGEDVGFKFFELVKGNREKRKR